MTCENTTPAAPLTQEEARVGATFRLTMMRDLVPELKKAEAAARLDLAAAIIAMDVAADIPGRHNLSEQVTVEDAREAYGHALADLLRGEAS